MVRFKQQQQLALLNRTDEGIRRKMAQEELDGYIIRVFLTLDAHTTPEPSHKSAIT